MKIFFIITSFLILLLLEVSIGSWGIFMPIVALGLIYFEKQYDIIINLILAITLGTLHNFLVGSNFMLLTPICYILVVLINYKQTKHQQNDLFTSSITGSIVFLAFNLIFYSINAFMSNDLEGNIFVFIAIMIMSILLGFLAMAILISLLDFFALKFKIEKFITATPSNNNLYQFGRSAKK